MENITDNMQKYLNYQEQMRRLNKALSNQFYLEAIFIEYAIIEDRLESILRHSGKWHPKPDQFVSVDAKRKKVAKLAEENKSLAHKYFSVELMNSINQWTLVRNQLIHALMKKTLQTDVLSSIALEGDKVAKLLCNKTTLYNRALKRIANREENTHV